MRTLLAQLEPHAMRRTYKKGAVVLYQGEAPRVAYVLKQGAIKAYTINTAGEEQIVTFHAAGDIFPGPWIFGKSSVTLYYYEALTDCEMLTIARDELLRIVRSSPELLSEALDYYATNYTGMLMRVTSLEQSRARDKIVFTLYYLLFRHGTEVRPGVFTIDIPLTHTTIASLVGLTRETTTTELNKLRQHKVLEYTARSYRVDKQKLERLLGEDSFSDVHIQ